MWQEIPIWECNESLLEVKDSNKLFTYPIYYKQGFIKALEKIYLRKSVAFSLQEAAQLLPQGFSLIVLDGYRSLELQQELYAKYSQVVKMQTGLQGKLLEEEVQKYVSFPSANKTRPSPHLTGAAVDVTLGDDSGRFLDMGGEYDELSSHSKTDYYEGYCKETHKQYRDKRRLLAYVLTSTGFSNYQEEWWHYDLGNQFHHSRVGGVARFGLTDLSED